MIATLGLKISEGFRRTAPDPFVLAVVLTLAVLGLALTLTDSTPAGDKFATRYAGSSGPTILTLHSGLMKRVQ